MLKQLQQLRTLLIALLVMVGAGNGWGQDTYVQLTSIDNIDGEAQYVLGIYGTGFHYEGTSSWGKTALPNKNAPIYYSLIKAQDGKSFKAKAVINNTEYYLQVPTSNTFSMATSSSSQNTDLIIGTTFGNTSNYAVANKGTAGRHLRINGTSGLRSYNGATGNMAFFYKVIKSTKTSTTITIDASGITNTDVYTGTEAGSLSASVTAGSSSVEGASVTWSSSTPSVAKIDSLTGNVTLVAAGTTKITASYAGNDDYAPSSAVYTLTVKNTDPAVETFTFANLEYENAQPVDTVSGRDCTLLFNNGTNTQNGPKYYTIGSGVRMYNGNTLTISSTTKTIGSIEFTFDGDNTALSLVQPGELSDVSNSKRTWTGNANSVQFTATATNRIQAITITYVTTVMGETTLQLSPSSVNTPYGTNATVNATVSDSYNGTLTAESSNTSIATASVKGTTITITPVAVGKATITVTAPETSTFSGEAKETINVTVTAPEGKTTAAQSTTITIFNETFDKNEGTGGNDGSWSGSIAQNNLDPDNDGWTFENGNGAKGCAKFGSSKYKGSATTPALRKSGTLTLSFRAAAWDGSNEGTTLNLSVSAGTIDESSVTLTKGEFKTYTATISNATTETTIKFEAANASNNRFFLDDVVVEGASLTATLNASGYATYCSEYPLDFSNADDYSAWQVTGVDGNTITFEKVTGSVKGGTGLLLMGKTSDTVTLTSEDSETVLETNKLEGTLAPTYVEANKYYGLSGKQFLKVNRGTVPAGKALLPARVVGDVNNVRTLSLVFVDPTTGIAETKTMEAEEGIYNLQGQRIGKAQRGVNIIGGKKVLVK